MKILISGYFGAKNLGDDLMVVEFCNYLNNCNRNLIITILKLFPNTIEKLPSNVRIIDLSSVKRGRGPIFKYFILPEYDGIYWVGGTCFTDTEGDGFYRYMNIALKRHKKIGYIGVGIGNLVNPERIDKMRSLIAASSFASFRDIDSYNIAKRYNENSILTDDLVYLGAEKYKRIKSQSNNLVIAWRNLHGYVSYEEEKKKIDELIEFLACVEKQYDKVQILAIDDSVDYQPSQYIYEHIKHMEKAELYFDCSVEKKCELILSAKVNVMARLHGIVLSELAGIKTIAISYSRKIDSFLQSIGNPKDGINVDFLSKVKLLEMYNRKQEVINETYIEGKEKYVEKGMNAFLNFLEDKENEK